MQLTTILQCAQVLGVSRQWLYDLCWRGKFPVTIVHGRYLVDPDEVRNYLATRPRRKIDKARVSA